MADFDRCPNPQYVDPLPQTPSLSYRQDAFFRFCRNRTAVIAFCIFIFLVTMALIGPMIRSYSFFEIHLELKNQPPSWRFWFGTDDMGRDLFCRCWWGARISLGIGLAAALIDAMIGVMWGAIAAYCGRWVDEVMMRICDILQTIPLLLTALILSTMMGTGLKAIFIALGINGWLNMGRITRAQILQIQESEYVLSARTIGASHARIVFRYLIPNAMGTILATATLTIPSAIFMEAFLSFLGVGLQAPIASWGVMINDGISAMEFYPWRLFFPSLLITLTMFSLNIVGNALRDALDPRLRQ